MRSIAVVIVVALAITSCGGGDSSPSSEDPAAAPAAAPAPAAEALPAVWTVTEGIETPESAYYDAASNSIYVSQMAGAPDGRDGNGRIVKLTTDGKVVSANWATGLNAPKGLRSYGGTLWTSDIDEVVGIDIASGKVSSRVKIAGAMFLNDVAAGRDGTIYVTDMMGNRIYAVTGGRASIFVEGEELEHPNGILADGDRLVVGGWGSQPKADFSTDVPGRLFAIALEGKAKTLITPRPFANVDGVESDGSGGFVVSDYLKGQIIHVSPGGETRPVATFPAGTADIAVVGKTVVVPHMNENKVAAYTVTVK